MLTICSMYLPKKVDQNVHYIGRKGEFTIYEGGLQVRSSFFSIYCFNKSTTTERGEVRFAKY